MFWKVVIAIFLAFIFGSLSGKTAQIFGIPFYQLYDLFGQVFLNALTLLVIPLVASAIISSFSQIKDRHSFRKLGLKTLSFYVGTIFLSILVGIFLVNIFQPGKFCKEIFEKGAKDVSNLKLLDQTEIFSQLLFKLVPTNIFEAASKGNILGVIFFSLLFGFAMIGKQDSLKGNTLLFFWNELFHILMNMTQFLMKMMPLGVFCLVAKTVASQGLQSINSLFYFFLTVFLGMILFCLVVLPLLFKLVGLKPTLYIRSIAPALFAAFSTSSSAATLPITMECVEKKAGVSRKICNFVVPLGTSMNMAGSALYECVAIFFIAQAYGIEMSFTYQIIVAFLSLITSMGVAGIPSGSLVAIMMILNFLGLPAEAIALILPLDRLLDMCRTVTNVFSDASCAVLVAHSEGEPVLSKSFVTESK